LGICVPVLAGQHAVLTSPVSFLARPARWLQLMASHGRAFTAGPNFAFEVAARKASDEEMAGHDLGNVLAILNGSERVQAPTLKRFAERFARNGLRDAVLRPSYGMAEATVFIATREFGEPPRIVHFDSEKLADGQVQLSADGGGTQLVSYGVPASPLVRIVDPDTRVECSAGTVGEIWTQGENVGVGYWRKPRETAESFRAELVSPSDGAAAGSWLRTGDLGFFFDDELFIIGRIKDLLIVYGRNHSPDDIEATIQKITRGRCVAISVPDDGIERLVAIVEFKNGADQEASEKLASVKNEVTAAISTSHGLSVSDLVLVPQGAIPITTSGKVRRRACVERYQQDRFARLDT
jgi:long-chain fatty acid adenylyltransferase FadD28